MRREIRKVNLLDLEESKAVGVKVPFTASGVFESTFTTKEATKYNIINYLLTGQGERYLNPTFGTPIRELLFENIVQDRIEKAKSIIKEVLTIYFPQVTIVNLDISGIPDKNLINLELGYKIENTNIEDEIVINFEQ